MQTTVDHVPASSQAPTGEARVDARFTIRRGTQTEVIHILGSGDVRTTIMALAGRALAEVQ
jgi:hypothetical protein